jgi:hypothetical protein
MIAPALLHYLARTISDFRRIIPAFPSSLTTDHRPLPHFFLDFNDRAKIAALPEYAGFSVKNAIHCMSADG